MPRFGSAAIHRQRGTKEPPILARVDARLDWLPRGRCHPRRRRPRAAAATLELLTGLVDCRRFRQAGLPQSKRQRRKLLEAAAKEITQRCQEDDAVAAAAPEPLPPPPSGRRRRRCSRT
jgi:hypothetical protein